MVVVVMMVVHDVDGEEYVDGERSGSCDGDSRKLIIVVYVCMIVVPLLLWW